MRYPWLPLTKNGSIWILTSQFLVGTRGVRAPTTYIKNIFIDLIFTNSHCQRTINSNSDYVEYTVLLVGCRIQSLSLYYYLLLFKSFLLLTQGLFMSHSWARVSSQIERAERGRNPQCWLRARYPYPIPMIFHAFNLIASDIEFRL